MHNCHYVKNHKAKRTKAMKHLNAAADYIIFLDGTPIMNRPMEMFNALNMIDGYEWRNAWAFGKRYAGGEYGKVDGGRARGRTFGGKTNVEELRGRLENYMIRRLKSDVLDELPDLVRTEIPLDIPNASEYNEASGRDYENALVKIGELWRIVGRGKAQAATSWVRDFFRGAGDNTKLVIKCHHVDNVIYLREALDDYNPTTITGDVTGAERGARITDYQTPGGARIIILTDAGSEGIDLFGIDGVDASNILFVERSWSPAREEQTEGRLHRLGQHNAVEAHYLIARGTIDERMAEVIEEKRRDIRDVVGLKEPETTVKEALAKEVQND